MPSKWGCLGQEVPDEISESPIESNWSSLSPVGPVGPVGWLKESPPRNVSNYVKTVGVLITSKWGCGGQEVPDKVSDGPIVSNWSCLTTFTKGSP